MNTGSRGNKQHKNAPPEHSPKCHGNCVLSDAAAAYCILRGSFNNRFCLMMDFLELVILVKRSPGDVPPTHFAKGNLLNCLIVFLLSVIFHAFSPHMV